MAGTLGRASVLSVVVVKLHPVVRLKLAGIQGSAPIQPIPAIRLNGSYQGIYRGSIGMWRAINVQVDAHYE